MLSVLSRHKPVSIHYTNIKYLLMEICKVKMSLSSPIMIDNFRLSENSSCSLRSSAIVNRRNIRTAKFGFETVSKIQRSLSTLYNWSIPLE